VAALLERIRVASDDLTIPSWACGSYRMLFNELQAAERDTFTHVHLENHVLAPRFAANISTFSLAEEATALEATPAWTASGHSAKTLVRRADARQVLIAFRPGGKLSEHRTEHSILVHVLRGRVQLRTPARAIELGEQQLVLLEAGIPHDLTALDRSWVLVTIHWPT
jgi:quercetin dioxygenase-like cupin family protein